MIPKFVARAISVGIEPNSSVYFEDGGAERGGMKIKNK